MIILTIIGKRGNCFWSLFDKGRLFYRFDHRADGRQYPVDPNEDKELGYFYNGTSHYYERDEYLKKISKEKHLKDII